MQITIKVYDKTDALIYNKKCEITDAQAEYPIDDRPGYFKLYGKAYLEQLLKEDISYDIKVDGKSVVILKHYSHDGFLTMEYLYQ